MSRRKSRNLETEPEARLKVTELFKEFVQKKFSGNASEAARQLGVKPQNADLWLKGTSIPGWILLKIFIDYPDVVESILHGEPMPASDPAIEDLVRRFRTLVETKDRMRTLWGLQVEACEDAERYKDLEAASSTEARPTMFPTSGMLAEREWLLQRINAVPENARFLALRKIEEALQSVKKITEQPAAKKSPEPSLEHPGKALPADKKTRRGRH